MSSIMQMSHPVIKEIDTSKFSKIRRSRYILSSGNKIGAFIEEDNVIFDGGFRKHPLMDGRDMPPLMRPWGSSSRGRVRYSDSFHAAANLLYCDDRSCETRINDMNTRLVHPNGIPTLLFDTTDVFDDKNTQLRHTLQQWIVDQQKTSVFPSRNNIELRFVEGPLNPGGRVD